MRLLLRSVMSVLPIALALAFMYDVGGARTAFAERMAHSPASNFSATSTQSVAAEAYRRSQETVRYEGRSYELSAAVVDAKVLGTILAGTPKEEGTGVTIRAIDGLSPTSAVAVRVVGAPKAPKAPETWRLAVIPGNPGP